MQIQESSEYKLCINPMERLSDKTSRVVNNVNKGTLQNTAHKKVPHEQLPCKYIMTERVDYDK